MQVSEQEKWIGMYIKCLKKIHSLNGYRVQVNCRGNLWRDVWIGRLQLAIHVVQNRHAGEKRPGGGGHLGIFGVGMCRPGIQIGTPF